VANAEWSAHSLLSSFLQESLFPRLPPPLHTVLTSAFALSCSAIPQLSDSATRHSIRMFFLGGKGNFVIYQLSIFPHPNFLKKKLAFETFRNKRKKRVGGDTLPLSKFPYSFVLQANNHKLLFCLGSFRSLSRVSYERIFIFLIFFYPLPERG
jgi:hypothetical protein